MNAAVSLVEVRVPDMGSFKDVAIIDVLVKPGESIEVEAPLVTLETEKATMDVPSTVGGVIEKLHIAKGGKVSTGDLIATVRSDAAPASETAKGAAAQSGPGAQSEVASTAAASASQRAPAPTAPAASPPTAASVSSAHSAPRAPVGAPAQPPAANTSARPAPSPAPAPSATNAPTPAQPGLPNAPRGALPPINEPGFSRAHAGPSVRKFARELGVDLTRLVGTGFKNRITHDDIKVFVKKALTTGAPVARPAAPGLPAVPAIDFTQFGPVETRPLSRIQRISGPRLHASWVNIPHVTQFDEADITDLEDARTRLKDKALQEGIKLTPLAFVMRACVKALQEFPQFNSSLDPSGASLVLKKYIHLGFAADTPNGLVVPVVHDANRKDVYEIARQLGELSEKARAGKLSPAEMQGGSFTISSLGGIGGTAFTPIINAPEVAILGVSRSAMRPVYRDGAFVPRLILPLSLSYDHRVIDGASAARFTTFLARLLADPRALTEAVP
jgi:pyruvate dehydrogenase E2 component (dihydrolipoamide acetyltransferase)